LHFYKNSIFASGNKRPTVLISILKEDEEKEEPFRKDATGEAIRCIYKPSMQPEDTSSIIKNELQTRKNYSGFSSGFKDESKVDKEIHSHERIPLHKITTLFI